MTTKHSICTNYEINIPPKHQSWTKLLERMANLKYALHFNSANTNFTKVTCQSPLLPHTAS